MAEHFLNDIVNRTRVECGLAAVLDLGSNLLEDKQPSFVTSETLKYLYLTFDEVSLASRIEELLFSADIPSARA